MPDAPFAKLLRWSLLSALLALCVLVTPQAIFAQSAQPAAKEPPPPKGYTSVVTGTRILIGLDDDLNTSKVKAGDKFQAHTLIPLSTQDGQTIPPGVEVTGHIARVEAAGTGGKGRVWLSLDDFQTPAGDMPLVAEVAAVPGDPSIKIEQSREGAIEATTNSTKQDAEAAGIAAAQGAVQGSKNGARGAAIAAATSAAASLLASAGIGQDLSLSRGTRVEIELIRPLYLPSR
jgi:hypothetical protein